MAIFRNGAVKYLWNDVRYWNGEATSSLSVAMVSILIIPG